MYLKVSKVNGNSAWPLAPVWPRVRIPTFVYAWELPGVAGNACNVPVNPGFRLGTVIVCSGFVADGAPQHERSPKCWCVDEGLPALRKVNSGKPHGLFKKNERCAWFKHAWATFLKLHSYGRMAVDEQTVMQIC
eukprot:Gb_25998 [translate_table: standard]